MAVEVAVLPLKARRRWHLRVSEDPLITIGLPLIKGAILN